MSQPTSTSDDDAATNDPTQLLPFAAPTDPVLHTPSATVEFPLSATDRLLIARMRHGIQPSSLAANNAAWPSAVGMAAPQWGAPRRIFLYCPSRDVHDDEKLETIINARYWTLDAASASADGTDATRVEEESVWEGCFSLPEQRGLVSRPTAIRVEYNTPDGSLVQKELHGWEARVFQHECDHTQGKLYSTAVKSDGVTLRCSELRRCTKEQVVQERAAAAAKLAAESAAASASSSKQA